MDTSRRDLRFRRALAAEDADIVVEMLAAQGCNVLDRHPTFRFGDLHLVLRDDGVTVFVQLRRRRQARTARRNIHVGRRRRRRMTQAARAWLAERRFLAHRPYRFDIASVTDDGCGLHLEVWRNAFAPEDG